MAPSLEAAPRRLDAGTGGPPTPQHPLSPAVSIRGPLPSAEAAANSAASLRLARAAREAEEESERLREELQRAHAERASLKSAAAESRRLLASSVADVGAEKSLRARRAALQSELQAANRRFEQRCSAGMAEAKEWSEQARALERQLHAARAARLRRDGPQDAESELAVEHLRADIRDLQGQVEATDKEVAAARQELRCSEEAAQGRLSEARAAAEAAELRALQLRWEELTLHVQLLGEREADARQAAGLAEQEAQEAAGLLAAEESRLRLATASLEREQRAVRREGAKAAKAEREAIVAGEAAEVAVQVALAQKGHFLAASRRGVFRALACLAVVDAGYRLCEWAGY